jgi:hypothetical protein
LFVYGDYAYTYYATGDGMTKFATNDDCLANSGGDTCDEYTN